MTHLALARKVRVHLQVQLAEPVYYNDRSDLDSCCS